MAPGPSYSTVGLVDDLAAEPSAALAGPRVRNAELLRAVRLVIRADSDPARQALFSRLLQSKAPVRLAYQVHERLGSRAAALLVAGVGLAAFLRIGSTGHPRARVLSVATHENARRQVARVCSWIRPVDCGTVGVSARHLMTMSALRSLTALVRGRRGMRVLRAIRAIDRRHGFLVACRAAQALAWYARTWSIMSARKPAAILVSSDSNPEEIGFIGAARALAIPQVFVSHAYPTPLSPPLDFTLSILEGDAAVAARGRKGPIRGTVLLAGVEGPRAPLDLARIGKRRPVIGVFTSKAFSWAKLAEIIDDCRNHCDAAQIVIRWHPSMLERPRLRHFLKDRSRVMVSPRRAALADVARQCDWVIADENSNVHLPLLKLGIPTVSIARLGIYPESRSDQYGFVANRVIFPPVASLRDLDPDALVEFLSDGWVRRFARYDASYLRQPDAIAREVAQAIGTLVDPAAALAAET